MFSSLRNLQPTRHRAGHRRQPTLHGKMSLNAAEDVDDEEEQAPPTDDEADSPSDEEGSPEPEAPEPEAEDLLGGAVVEALEPVATVTMGATDNYDNMSDDEKRCFESFIASQLDSSLEVGSEQWVTAFSQKLGDGLEQWNGLSPDERLRVCAGAAPRKAKCGGGRARSRSRSGRQGSAKKKKRNKKGWTCYTHFFVEKLNAGGIKLTRANFAEVVRDIAKQWHDLSDEDWKKYKCRCKRRKPKAPAAAAAAEA